MPIHKHTLACRYFLTGAGSRVLALALVAIYGDSKCLELCVVSPLLQRLMGDDRLVIGFQRSRSC